MNPTLPQAIVDDAMAEDRAAALSEFYGQFREDVALYLPRDIVERAVVPGRAELQPRPDIRYWAFVDMSGGRSDSATLAIAHRLDRKVVLDFLREWRPPFSPQTVIEDMARNLRRFGLKRATGDAYGAEYTASGFASAGINYAKANKSKNELYLELLPRLCSGEIELLDNERLIAQLSNLERRTRSGGKDVVDHPPGGHDDLANVVAGVSDSSAHRGLYIGTLDGYINQNH